MIRFILNIIFNITKQKNTVFWLNYFQEINTCSLLLNHNLANLPFAVLAFQTTMQLYETIVGKNFVCRLWRFYDFTVMEGKEWKKYLLCIVETSQTEETIYKRKITCSSLFFLSFIAANYPTCKTTELSELWEACHYHTLILVQPTPLLRDLIPPLSPFCWHFFFKFDPSSF